MIIQNTSVYTHKHLYFLCLALLTSSSCFFQEPDYSWLVDKPKLLSIRLEVVESKTNSPLVPEGYVRNAPAFNDKIRLTPLIIGPDGPLDAEALKPMWFYHSDRFSAYPQNLPSNLHRQPPCEIIILGGGTPCYLGAGNAFEVLLAAPFYMNIIKPDNYLWWLDNSENITIIMVSTTVPEITSEECWERLHSQGELDPCIFATKTFTPENKCRLLQSALHTTSDNPEGIQGIIEQLPIDYCQQALNLDPRFEHIVIEISHQQTKQQWFVKSGTKVNVSPGDQIRVRLELEPTKEKQIFYMLDNYAEPPFEAVEMTETLYFTPYLTVPPENSEQFIESVFDTDYSHQWVVPAGHAKIFEYILLEDWRNSFATSSSWAWIEFEVTPHSES